MWLYRRFWIFIILDCLLRIKSITVKFPLKEPHYVALNRTLRLDAEIVKDPAEQVTMFTWDCSNSHGEVRLITDAKAMNPRASVENGGARLIIAPVTELDFGRYRFTVTDKQGAQKSDSVQVVRSEQPLNASLVLKCIVPRAGAPWDTPKYTWQVDGEQVNNAAQLSEDGSALYLSGELGRSYACLMESALGAIKTQTRAKGPDPDTQRNGSSSTGWLIAFVVLEGVVIVAFILKYLKWRMSNKNQGVV